MAAAVSSLVFSMYWTCFFDNVSCKAQRVFFWIGAVIAVIVLTTIQTILCFFWKIFEFICWLIQKLYCWLKSRKLPKAKPKEQPKEQPKEPEKVKKKCPLQLTDLIRPGAPPPKPKLNPCCAPPNKPKPNILVDDTNQDCAFCEGPVDEVIPPPSACMRQAVGQGGQNNDPTVVNKHYLNILFLVCT